MGLNSTVVMTVVLLVLMFGAGFFSSAWGYKLGREALKEITQPDVRPSNLTGKIEDGDRKTEGVKMLKEGDILANVKKRMEGKDEEVTASSPATPQGEQKAEQKPEQKAEEKPEEKPEEKAATSTFPIVSRDEGVTLEVTSATQTGSSLLLKVQLKNESDTSIRFLYSFLNVTDDKGRALSASVDDLPGQLPPDSQTYLGTVSIPTALLDNANELAISLTDYPDQKLKLQMTGIPIVR
ncbi:hypothetical protein ACL6C3_23160 [Capilliphycus salinus ALCB114379]|uniref:hypothetical protein n=1 Tax=Capilliphycus salinus TaxID=2768948 RepID=UPI0039A5E58A